MAHFAVTDAEAGAFEAHERFSRAALGLAGAEAAPGKPFRVWLEDWSASAEAVASGAGASTPIDRAVPAGGVAPAEPDFQPLRLRAAQGPIAVDLVLRSGKPRVLQGDSGYSRKGPEPGNASLYYSYTRMPTAGRIRTARGEFAVSGTSWLDREWGSSLLSPGLAGWEWFGLRLADSTDWVFFRLRKSGPEAAAEDSVAFDYGLRVDAAGGTRVLGPGEATARILSRWTGAGGSKYPARWRIRVPAESLEMDLSPVLAGQELRLSIPYWEGAVRIRARLAGREIAGRGYMELTGH
jgi:predicted secreted hydrolase